jgi:ATP-binding cassette subfamily B protein
MSEDPPAAGRASADEAVALTVSATLRHLFAKLAQFRLATTLLVVALLIDVAYETLLPLSLKFLVDEAIEPRQWHAFILILGVLVAAYLVSVASAIGRDYLYAWLGGQVLHDFRIRMYGHLQRQSMDFFGRMRSGDLLSRFTTDLAAVENVMVLGLPMAFLATANILVSSTVLFILEWKLAMLLFLALPFCVLGPRILGPRALMAGSKLRLEQGVLASMVQENLQAQRVVKAFSLQGSALDQFHTQSQKIRYWGTSFGFYCYATERAPNIGMGLFNVLVLTVGGYLAFQGELSVGSLVSFNMLFLNVSGAVMTLSSFAPTLLQATSGLERIHDLLDTPPRVSERAGAVALQPLAKAIRLENVSFSYTGERRNLDGVSLEIPRGARVAFVGASGCGKSTCLNLILRFFDPDEGRVCYDGVDLRDASLDSLAARMGVVFQDNVLFNASVRENVRMGRAEATDEEVEAACRLAELHSAIVAMPQGYDSPVGENGSRLSGGQRQRLAIARALIRRPSILVLDEATSALDPSTEAAINATLDRLAGEQTTITVTHRLSPLVNYDRIFVFSEGHLMEAGDHRELLARGGIYADLWAKQNTVEFSEDGAHARVDPASLRRIGIFKDLDETVCGQIAGLFRIEEAAPGAIVFRQFDVGDKFYVIARGRVRVSATTDDGAEHTLAVLQDGDNFGEVALLQDSPRNATVTSEAATVFLTLRRTAFQRLLERYPGILATLQQQLKVRHGAADAAVSIAS